MSVQNTVDIMKSFHPGDITSYIEKKREEYPKFGKAMDVVIGSARLIKQIHNGVGAGSKRAGINFSLASLLRQSQLFTGTVGAFFQVLGAFLDVTLAPFMPIIFKVIGLIAAAIPYWAKAVNTLWGWFGIMWNALKNLKAKIINYIKGRPVIREALEYKEGVFIAGEKIKGSIQDQLSDWVARLERSIYSQILGAFNAGMRVSNTTNPNPQGVSWNAGLE